MTILTGPLSKEEIELNDVSSISLKEENGAFAITAGDILLASYPDKAYAEDLLSKLQGAYEDGMFDRYPYFSLPDPEKDEKELHVGETTLHRVQNLEGAISDYLDMAENPDIDDNEAYLAEDRAAELQEYLYEVTGL